MLQHRSCIFCSRDTAFANATLNRMSSRMHGPNLAPTARRVRAIAGERGASEPTGALPGRRADGGQCTIADPNEAMPGVGGQEGVRDESWMRGLDEPRCRDPYELPAELGDEPGDRNIGSVGQARAWGVPHCVAREAEEEHKIAWVHSILRHAQVPETRGRCRAEGKGIRGKRAKEKRQQRISTAGGSPFCARDKPVDFKTVEDPPGQRVGSALEGWSGEG